MNPYLISAVYASEAEVEATVGGIAALGIDWRALLFQVLNFSVLLVVLRLVAYKPILRILDARRVKIEESLKNASDIETMKQQMQAEQKALLTKTEKEAEAILDQTRQQSANMVKVAEQQAEARTKQVVAQAQKQIAQETEVIKTQLKEELIEVVAKATAKVAGVKIDDEQDEKLIREALQQVQMPAKK